MNLTKNHPIFTASQWCLGCSVFSNVEHRTKCCRTATLLRADPVTKTVTRRHSLPGLGIGSRGGRGVATFFPVCEVNHVHDIYNKKKTFHGS